MPKKSSKILKSREAVAETRSSRPPYLRMLKIHEALSTRNLPNCSALAMELEVSAKTIQRDIDFMRDQMLLPIGYDRVRHGFHYTEAVANFPMLNVTHGEIVALLVAQKAVEQYRGTAFEKPLKAAFEKLSSGLKDEISIPMDQLAEAFSFRPIGLPAAEMKAFEVVSDAVLHSQALEFDYQSLKGDKPKRHRVEPYHLGCIDNQWYLFGHDTAREKVLTFAITRLSNPANLNLTFSKPADFSLSKMMAGSFSAFEAGKTEQVRIRLDDFGARLAAERTWHKSQKITRQPEGGALLSMDVGIAPDLENWILSWGEHAEVIAPDSLREHIAAKSRAMAAKY